MAPAPPGKLWREGTASAAPAGGEDTPI